MSFELIVSAQRDPLEGRHSTRRVSPACATHAAVAVNGSFDESASEAVLKTVADLAAGETRSIVVDMQDVEVRDTHCLAAFADALMAQRRAGVHVQVAARDAGLHATLAQLPDARDWLLVFAKTDTGSARVAIHVDGITGAD